MAYEPQFSDVAREAHERMFPGESGELAATDPEFVERMRNFMLDEVASTVELDERTRFLGWEATLLGCQGIEEFRVLLPAALHCDVSPVALKEVIYQGTAYLGIGRTYPFLTALNEELEATGVELPLELQAATQPTEADRLAQGNQAQVDIFGEGMRGFQERGKAEYPWINRWLADNCFGDWYTRGGLSLAERELVTFCYIAAQGGCEPQLKAHAAGNRSIGNPKGLLIRVVSSNLPLIGYPRTLNALAALDAGYASNE